MKKLIAIIAVIGMAGSIYAGCGTKVPVEGTLSAYDAETKTLTVGKKEVTLDASATISDAEGNAVEIDTLVGKDVVISTDKHTKKAEEVKAKA